MDDGAVRSGVVMLDVATPDDSPVPASETDGAGGGPLWFHRMQSIPAIEWVGLVACLAPIVAACIRAFAADWRPVYDSAYFTTRSFDVLTSHHPFVGSWSTFGAVLLEPLHNVGPLQLLALAPFTRVHPYVGTAIGVGFVNVLAVFAVWFTSRRMFGRRGVVAVMAATAVLMMSFGAPAFVDARQQHALLLPFWALLWLTADLMRGTNRALLPWIVASSFVLQTHNSYAYLVGVIIVAGLGGYIRSPRRRLDRSSFRWHVGGAVLAVALWAHTIWDEVFGDGNLSTLLSHASGEHPAGWLVGARIVADSPFGFPWWWPGSVRDFHEPWTFGSAFASAAVVAWIVALGAAALLGARRGDRRVVTLGGLSVALVVTALVTAARIPRSGLDSLPQTYFWLWPISLFAGVALVASFSPLMPRTEYLAEGAAAFTTLMALLALPNRYVFPPWNLADELMETGGRTMLADIGHELDEISFDLGDAVVVEDVTFRILVPDYYNILGELIRHGIDVHFPAGSGDIERFGHDRCETGSEKWRLRIVVGGDRPELSRLDVVLASLDGASPEVAAEYEDLNDTMLDRMYANKIEIDRERLETAGDAGPMMLQILDTPGESHGDVWIWFFTLVEQGDVTIPPQYRPDYLRWSDLARASIASDLLVYLIPNYFPRAGDC